MEHIEKEMFWGLPSGHLLSLDIMSLWQLHNGVCGRRGVCVWWKARGQETA